MKTFKPKDIEIIDLTNKNLFEAIQVIVATSSENTRKKSGSVLKYKSNIPNIENTVKEFPFLSVVEFV